MEAYPESQIVRTNAGAEELGLVILQQNPHVLSASVTPGRAYRWWIVARERIIFLLKAFDQNIIGGGEKGAGPLAIPAILWSAILSFFFGYVSADTTTDSVASSTPWIM